MNSFGADQITETALALSSAPQAFKTAEGCHRCAYKAGEWPILLLRRACTGAMSDSMSPTPPPTPPAGEGDREPSETPGEAVCGEDRVERVFDSAMARPTDERLRFVDEAGRHRIARTRRKAPRGL